MYNLKPSKNFGICAIVLATTALSGCTYTKHDTNGSDALAVEKSFESKVQDALYGYDAEIKPGQYEYKRVNLNNDSWDDAVALMHFESGYCGNAGCSLMTLIGEPDAQGQLHVIGNTTLVNRPVLKSADSTHGFHDILVWVSGGGYPAMQVALKYDGQKYTENASSAIESNGSVGTEILFSNSPDDANDANIGNVQTLSGRYVYGHEVSAFISCDSKVEYWATGQDEIMKPLRDKSLAKAQQAEQPYQSIYAVIEAKTLPQAEEGFAADYDKMLDILAIKQMTSIIPESCLETSGD